MARRGLAQIGDVQGRRVLVRVDLNVPIDEHGAVLVAAEAEPTRYFETEAAAPRRPGVKLDSADPLGVVLYGKSGGPPQAETVAAEDVSGMQGTVVALSVAEGTTVHAGQEVLILEAMKMQHALTVASAGIVRVFSVAAGDTVFEGHPLAFIEERADLGGGTRQQEEIDPARERRVRPKPPNPAPPETGDN